MKVPQITKLLRETSECLTRLGATWALGHRLTVRNAWNFLNKQQEIFRCDFAPPHDKSMAWYVSSNVRTFCLRFGLFWINRPIGLLFCLDSPIVTLIFVCFMWVSGSLWLSLSSCVWPRFVPVYGPLSWFVYLHVCQRLPDCLSVRSSACHSLVLFNFSFFFILRTITFIIIVNLFVYSDMILRLHQTTRSYLQRLLLWW